MTIALSQCPGIDPIKDSSAALQAALNLKQPITWDCPVNCVMGPDYTKGIFVPDGSDVTFTPQGLLSVDNAGFPALAFMHAAGTWRGTKIRYTGSLGIASPSAAGAWTNGPAKNYLVKNGYNTLFNGVGGTYWAGPTNPCALISVRGAANMTFNGVDIFVDEGVTADKFAPVAFAFDLAYVPGEVCAPGAALVAPNVTVSNASLDGFLMGFVGGGNQVVLEDLTFNRYADLQDAAGGNVGGTNTWFAPPHAIYLQGSPANPMTAKIRNYVDLATFCGSPLRRLTASGYINSIKLELANGSSIDGLYSRRADGGLGVLSNGSTVGGTAKNMFFLIDTSITSVDGKGACTSGVFFPSGHPYPASSISATIANLQNSPPPVLNVPASVTLQTVLEQAYGA